VKVFIAGPRAISELCPAVEERLNKIYANNITVLVGDADGVDKAVQYYFNSLGYRNVIVFASGRRVRNNVGNWEIRKIDVPANIRGFDFYTKKDEAMASDAEYGFMIWNGESKGTLNNIINMLAFDKKTLVYLTKTDSMYSIDSMEKLQELLDICGQNAQNLFNRLSGVASTSSFQQLTIFD